MIVVTLVCFYAACWGPTKRRVDNRPGVKKNAAVAPLILSVDFEECNPRTLVTVRKSRRYYFWFFGLVAELPFEQEISVSPQL